MRGQVETGFTAGAPWHPPKSLMAVQLRGLGFSRTADGFFMPSSPPEALSDTVYLSYCLLPLPGESSESKDFLAYSLLCLDGAWHPGGMS